MTHEQTFTWLLELRRERMRNALGDMTTITPVEAWTALGHLIDRYDAHKAEAICGLLAGIGFVPDGRGENWTRTA